MADKKTEVKPALSGLVPVVNKPEALAALDRAGPAREVEMTPKQMKELAVREQEDAIEAAAKKFAGEVDSVAAAKPEEFEEGEKDFWRPSAEEHTLQGIFIGTATPGRYKQHAILVKGRDGRPLPVRMLGTHKLSRELAKYLPGDALRIEYMGELGVEIGKMKDFKVSLLKAQVYSQKTGAKT